MKKYKTPKMRVIKPHAEDVIRTSVTEMPDTFNPNLNETDSFFVLI